MFEMIVLAWIKLQTQNHNQELRAAPEQAATLWATESYQPQALCFASKNKGADKVLSKTQREGAGSGLGAGDTSKLTRKELKKKKNNCH